MIRQEFDHSRFGNFMFGLCAKWTEFIVDHKVLFYILALTWGLPLTLFGVVVTIILAIAKIFNKNIKFEKFLWVYDIRAGKWWGGFETGLMFVRDLKSDLSLSEHEFGHAIQNTLFGPLQIILSLTSVIRYWYQTFREMAGKDNVPYNAYWLEDAASQCGKYIRNKIQSQ